MFNFRKAISALKARFGLPPATDIVEQALPSATVEVEPAPVDAAPVVKQHEMVLCVPGQWADASDFASKVAALDGHYSDAGFLLARAGDTDRIKVDIGPAEPRLALAFRVACQGKIDEDTLRVLSRHTSVAYLYFPADLAAQSALIIKFSRLMERVGGLAVKVETCGVAHSWAQWAILLKGALPGQYAAGVTLVTSADFYYSCGMHNFGLPDCEVPGAMDFDSAMHLMNQFNLWRLSALPSLSDGHSFSLGKDAPSYRLYHQPDQRHADHAPLSNPHGLWRLNPA